MHGTDSSTVGETLLARERKTNNLRWSEEKLCFSTKRDARKSSSLVKQMHCELRARRLHRLHRRVADVAATQVECR